MRRSQDFDVAVRRGRRAGRRTLVVHAAVPSDGVRTPLVTDPDAVRVGFVVSRAVGPAVVRNRVKRRLRALMAERVDGLPAGSLVVVRANPAAAVAPWPLLATDLDAALSRATRPTSGVGREERG